MDTKGLYMYPCLPSAQAVGGCTGLEHGTMGPCRRGSKQRSVRWIIRTGILLAIFAVSTFFFSTFGSRSNYDTDADGSGYRRRHLLNTESENATHSGVESCNYEREHVPTLFIIVYAIFVLIFFISLAIICDDFFVPSLEVISERLELSEDVAGATFMAAGSSAPELFTSLAGVSQESDVGIGTIVGSAVFNILIIIALSSALAGQVLQLDWRPLLRDSLYYGLSIICFIIFSWDGVFELYEAIILLVLYAFYILIMKFNSSIMDLSRNGCRRTKVEPLESGSTQGDVTEAALGSEAAQMEKQTSHTDRKMSITSTTSGNALVKASSSHKHIFHHIKHGELAASFTSSQADVRRPGDADSQAGSHAHPMGSRIGSLAGSIIIENSDESEPRGGQPPAGPRPEHGDPLAPVLVTDMYSNSKPTTPHRQMQMLGGGGDAQSLGGVSSGEFGSRSRLHIPYSGFNDADSGIHSAQGPTPVNPDPSYPTLHSDPDPSDLKANKRHSITVVHHEHLVPAAATNGSEQPIQQEIIEEDEVIDEELTLRPIPCLPAISMYYPDCELLKSRCGCVRYALKWLMFFISFPFMCAFTWTIPNCSNPKYKRFYVLSFTMSIVWIALLSFAMVTLVSKIGCLLYINAYTMGLVVVAIGTSVPDALSSILVARDGFGDMAVSNAIGSNVFDINLGLGLPFLISIIAFNQPLALLTPEEFVMLESGALLMTPHAKFGFILLAILVVALFIFTLVRFKLNKVVGISFVVMYVLFMIYAFVQEVFCKYIC